MSSSLNGTGVTFSDSTTQSSGHQACQAWVNYNAVGQSIRASYNVSSVTYSTTGDYTINYTNAFSDANYSVSGISMRNTTGSSQDPKVVSVYGDTTYGNSMKTTSTRISVRDGNGSAEDPLAVFVQVFR